MPRNSRAAGGVVTALVALLVAVAGGLGLLTVQDRGGPSGTVTRPTTAASPVVSGPQTHQQPDRHSGLRIVSVADLPPEARQTLALIARGGPYPYRQDGVVFQNRENRLPRQSRGYYHEYTVATPGSPDRGARRIVTGERGERYYTADHYRTFAEVVGHE